MTDGTRTIDRLRELPLSERFDALDDVVTGEFKSALLMTDDEEFPRDESFFDIGLTSLRLTEIKQRLDEQLDCTISETELFNQPTLDRLLDHLCTEVIPELFVASTSQFAARPAVAERG